MIKFKIENLNAPKIIAEAKTEINISDWQNYIPLDSSGLVEGKIKAFDRYVLVIENREGEIIIFKHAVASITYDKAFKNSNINFFEDCKTEKGISFLSDFFSLNPIFIKKSTTHL